MADEKVKFPWERTPSLDNEVDIKPSSQNSGLSFLKKSGPYLVFGTLVLGSFILKNSTSKEISVNQPASLEVVVAPIIISKGSTIPKSILQSIAIKSGDLTKQQKLRLIRPFDAEKLPDNLIAKRNLPPNRPLVWDDFEFAKQRLGDHSLRATKAPRVIYGEGHLP